MVYEPLYHALQIRWLSVVLSNKVGKNSRYFVGVFHKRIIPLALVGYGMIIANSARSTISYATRSREIIV